MFKQNRVLAVIPARSGSKQLKNKNILPLLGKPLLSYSIEAAQNTNIIDEIYVSTDSEIYADLALKHGAKVPFLRSKQLAEDSSSSWDCVLEALENYKKIGECFDLVVLLQPTSPLRTSQDILGALDLFVEKEADSVISVTEAEHSPLWYNVLPENLSLRSFLNSKILSTPRQELPTYYRLNGAIYVVRTEYIVKSRDIYNCNSFAYVMPSDRSIDIDTKMDFEIAELILSKFLN